MESDMGLKGLGWAITLWCVFKGTECVCILREEEEMKTYRKHKRTGKAQIYIGYVL